MTVSERFDAQLTDQLTDQWSDPGTGQADAIGIVGGGQLAWMLARAARELAIPLQVQTPSATDPAARLASGVVLAAVDDPAGTAELARRCRAISFENEWLPLAELALLERQGVRFVPCLEAIGPLVSKRSQRELLDRLNLPSPPWCDLERVLRPPLDQGAAHAGQGGESGAGTGASADPPPSPFPPAAPQRPTLPAWLQFPLMAKASRGGYDGRGLRAIADQHALESLLAEVDPDDWILEQHIAFERELALVACRDASGAVATYPLVETHQHQGVCDWVLQPAPVDHTVEAFARNVAASLLTALDYEGVLTIEFFYGPSGLLVNELAPRTHNSGHLTIEACCTSQFSQQLRIVAGRGLGPTDARLAGALMVNLLGFETLAGDDPSADYGDRRRDLEALPGAQVHWYGKQGAAPGRKLGHVTLPLDATDPQQRRRDAEHLLQQVRAIWPLPQPLPLE
ncbi:MAG: 5-(carboxyamino)imidazole ribonucleotide synthase [Synechococcaceae cyanobacterium]|jgi:5-(carboxyamino)imidazole ribonucleotide synthase